VDVNGSNGPFTSVTTPLDRNFATAAIAGSFG
jgi:hypothetical protein